MSKSAKEEKIIDISPSAISKIESYIDSMKTALDELKGALKPTLRFDAIKSMLTPNIIEEIFREFSPKIKHDEEIIKSKMRISKGSLNMDLMSGLWNRFSTKDNGDIFKFVSFAEDITEGEALEIISNRIGIRKLGQYKSFNYPEYSKISKKNNSIVSLQDKLQTTGNALTVNDEWIPLDNLPADVKEFIPEKDLSFILKDMVVEDVYKYKNKFGKLIGYCLRTHSKIDNKKQVRPVAYCYNKVKNKHLWMLKGFLDRGYKPIYRVEELSKDPLKPILIVEGEKTADKASKLFSEFMVISWLGGSQVIKKVDWGHIKGREVIIWPDNDEPGIIAANNILGELAKVNEGLVFAKVIDVTSLDLPAKWDLADQFPSNLSMTKINLMMKQLLRIK